MSNPLQPVSEVLPKLLPKILDLLDTNISNFERLEARYKVKRKISMITLFPAMILLLIGGSFLLTILLGDLLVWYTIVPVIILPLFIKAGFKKRHSILASDRAIILFVFLFLVWSLTYGIQLTISTLNEFNWGTLILALLLLLLSAVHFIPIYFFTFSRVAMLLENQYKDKYLEFELINNQRVCARLITITKRGDYIIQVLNSNTQKYDGDEVFLNRAHVISIIYRQDDRGFFM